VEELPRQEYQQDDGQEEDAQQEVLMCDDHVDSRTVGPWLTL
jgi:hypothetical protein